MTPTIPETELKIAVNTRLVIEDHMEGIGRFTFEVLSRIIESHPDSQFHLMFDRRYRGKLSKYENVRCHRIFPPFKHVWVGPYWFDVALRRRLKKIRPDVFLSTDSMNMLRPVCPMMTVLHDLNFEYGEIKLPAPLRKYYRNRVPIVARESAAVITVSEFSKRDISQRYGLKPEDIHVIYNGLSGDFRPGKVEEEKEFKKKLTGGREYFLFVGGMYHRKNLVRLLKAFEKFKSDVDSDAMLVLAGRKVAESAELFRELDSSPYRKDVIIPGRVSEKNLALLYSAAIALTYVSILEGFGIPVLEAYGCGCPAIVSNGTSLPEIAGDAALYVDPLNIDSIAVAMAQLYSDRDKRKELSKKALERSGNFSWDDSAEKLWGILKAVASKA